MLEKKLPRRNFRFECLETRNLLAGNVIAQQLTGFLLIDGDDSANAIVIT